jgi:hypothetical protein
MEGPAFVGVSLDSTLFSREWVRGAISYIVSRHTSLEFVLGDRLLAFNKTIRQDPKGHLLVDLPGGEARIAKRVSDIYEFLVSEVLRLAEGERSRVSISRWDDHCDARFTNIARVLNIAYSSVRRFKQCVDRDVEAHLFNQINSPHPAEIHRRLCTLYVIEETAMIIRISEWGKPYEYYPQKHIYTLTDIYQDRFADLGLTVEALVGHPRTRLFTPLPLVEASSGQARAPVAT